MSIWSPRASTTTTTTARARVTCERSSTNRLSGGRSRRGVNGTSSVSKGVGSCTTLRPGTPRPRGLSPSPSWGSLDLPRRRFLPTGPSDPTLVGVGDGRRRSPSPGRGERRREDETPRETKDRPVSLLDSDARRRQLLYLPYWLCPVFRWGRGVGDPTGPEGRGAPTPPV